MNPHQILRLFPNASKSVLSANANDYGTGVPEEDQPVDTRNGAGQPQRGSVQALALAGSPQEAVGGRITVRITVRKCGILQDPDNGFFKPLVDQLRHCGIIPEDNPGTIKLETEQVRVKTKAEAGTQVEVIYP